jgi:hypothetical protein
METLELEIEKVIEETVRMFGRDDAIRRWQCFLIQNKCLYDTSKSRQHNWQRKCLSEGRCVCCGGLNTIGGRHCDKCSDTRNRNVREKRHRRIRIRDEISTTDGMKLSKTENIIISLFPDLGVERTRKSIREAAFEIDLSEKELDDAIEYLSVRGVITITKGRGYIRNK